VVLVCPLKNQAPGGGIVASGRVVLIIAALHLARNCISIQPRTKRFEQRSNRAFGRYGDTKSGNGHLLRLLNRYLREFSDSFRSSVLRSSPKKSKDSSFGGYARWYSKAPYLWFKERARA
jgi:hypothetical protein